ncbi:phosphoenolpyruvate synthase [Amycolatopsis acidicola]|uniref:Phosphoenolpyruvate synthase n=1 Tax=Amycolatopsis acidicola TaxID=2596893 RepID=A0A5N0UY98_9PSEU|nr:PEP-utilizing enzyme [Amycolatopsis acidicola]KAA9155929.1 phosphoenolpyruvate synthase [Amycolatopsis acidicola]
MRGKMDGARAFEFGTKSETLARLSALVSSAVVLPLVSFTVAEWQHDPGTVLAEIRGRPWSGDPLVVRSSGRDEDQSAFSNAGRYLSETDVRGQDELVAAIGRVVASYDVFLPNNQVFVQPQLADSLASGVVSSCEPSCGAPYRVVNWADGPDTTAVTSGRATVRTWYFLDGAAHPPVPWLARIPELVRELESLSRRPFEFEFGVAADGTLVLFQMRLLAKPGKPVPRVRHRDAVAECRRRLHRLWQAQTPALGPETVFGVMPDWNPAEMIGIRPRPLALSLYRTLITDEVWAESRHRYGYRDLRGAPLLIDLHGLPYIDTRASFSSLVPASVPDDTAERLVTGYVRKLRQNPHLHDKVEFTIALSSYHFTIAERAAELVRDGVLSRAESTELVHSLRNVTTRMMSEIGPYRRDLGEIEQLRRLPLHRPETFRPKRISALVHLCKRAGTLPFSGIARAAFAATSVVRSLVELGVLSPEDGDALLSSSQVASAALQRDFAELSRSAFLRRYGHLRPGTYDILSPRYDEDPARYFDWSRPAANGAHSPGFLPGIGQMRELRRLMAEHRLPGTAHELLRFIVQSVAAREYSKLQFSRVVSEILVDAKRAGEWLGFTPDDMSYTRVEDLCGLTGDHQRDKAALRAAIESARYRHEITETLCAPVVLSDPDELVSFATMADEANFVTQGRVIAPVADVSAGDDPAGCVAMISAADPGYDWIFTRGIRGLITAFGGANSHMAIRALELGIPAAIGVGEAQFTRLLYADVLEVDAASKLVRPSAGAGVRIRETGAA